MSTQGGFGDILAELGRGQGGDNGELKELAAHIMTTSPDVTVSTNLGPWVNRRGIFDRHTRNDVFRDSKLASAQRWGMSPLGQHVELGIAEQNLFLLLGAAGLTPAMTGARILPIGTVYDPFVNRGLDALLYACYQDARFLLVSDAVRIDPGAPEGGQHQSVNTLLIGMAADRLASFEPDACRDELAILLRHALEFMQEPDGSAVWLRLSTRTLAQPERTLDPAEVIAGAHWVVRPAEGARLALAYQGPVATEVMEAFEAIAEDSRRGRVAGDYLPRPVARGLAGCDAGAAGTGDRNARVAYRADGACATGSGRRAGDGKLDGHPATHAWLGSVRGQRVVPLGVDHFGQGGDIPDLYHAYGLDTDAILDACAQALLGTESEAMLTQPKDGERHDGADSRCFAGAYQHGVSGLCDLGRHGVAGRLRADHAAWLHHGLRRRSPGVVGTRQGLDGGEHEGWDEGDGVFPQAVVARRRHAAVGRHRAVLWHREDRAVRSGL